MIMLKLLLIFTISALTFTSATNVQQICVGCTKPLTGASLKEAEKALTLSLSKLAAGSGPTYRLIKINTASHQPVSGSLYRINADLMGADNKRKTCNVRIHSQPWLTNGIEVTFECYGEQKVTRRHSA